MDIVSPGLHDMEQQIMLLSLRFYCLILEIVEKYGQILLMGKLLREKV